MTKTETMYDREKMAREELRERMTDEWQDEPHDTIHEIADGCVPVYHSDLLELAADDNRIALDSHELGPAFDGSPTPINIIAANVFERLEAACWEEWREMVEEREAAEEEE